MVTTNGIRPFLVYMVTTNGAAHVCLHGHKKLGIRAHVGLHGHMNK